MNGAVKQWQIVTSNPDAVARFYAAAFGWRVDRANALGYRVVHTGDDGVAGGIWPAPEGAPTFVQLFVHVDDVDAAVAKSIAEGASIIVPRSALPDGDVMAVLKDPAGLAFGVFGKRG